jgi:GNAT superfamily N-acetyltransferase
MTQLDVFRTGGRTWHRTTVSSPRRVTTTTPTSRARSAPPEPVPSSRRVPYTEPSPVLISEERVITGDIADELWRQYWANFEPLQSLAVQKQHSDRDEFLALLADPRVIVYVGWEGARPVGMAMITNALETVPELSPPFLRTRFPEQAAREAIYVGIYVMVDPAHRGITLFHRLYTECWQLAARARGVLVVDTCQFNRTTFDTDSLARRIGEGFPNCTVSILDQQTWYAAELPEPLPDPPRR